MEDLKQIQEFFSKPLEENVDKKYSDFLVALRDSGITNMFGAAPYLQAEFGLDKREAREVLANWMRSFGESLNEISKEDAWKKFQKEKSVTDKTIKAARKDFEKEWEAGKLNEGEQLDIIDFAKVVKAVHQTGHPVTVLLTPKLWMGSFRWYVKLLNGRC